MRPQQKNNRNRTKTNRPKSMGNVSNRVFESAGPEGKVRGTPQQIVEKYEQLARDSTLSGDRVMAENFLQHAEHYARLLSAAQAELQAQADADQRRLAEQQQRQAEQQQQRQNEQPRAEQPRAEQPRSDPRPDRAEGDAPRRPRHDRVEQPQPQPQPDDHVVHEAADKGALAVQDDAAEAGLVPTPETEAAAKPRRRRSPRRAARAEGDADAGAPDEGVRRTAERGRRRAKPVEAASDAAPAPVQTEVIVE